MHGKHRCPRSFDCEVIFSLESLTRRVVKGPGMKNTYIADAISLSPAYGAFRHHRHFEPAVYTALIAAGAVVASLSVAALTPSSPRPSASALDEAAPAAPAVNALADGSDTDAALLMLGRGCIGGDAVSCNDLGVSLLQGYGGSVDVTA